MFTDTVLYYLQAASGERNLVPVSDPSFLMLGSNLIKTTLNQIQPTLLLFLIMASTHLLKILHHPWSTIWNSAFRLIRPPRFFHTLLYSTPMVLFTLIRYSAYMNKPGCRSNTRTIRSKWDTMHLIHCLMILEGRPPEWETMNNNALNPPLRRSRLMGTQFVPVRKKMILAKQDINSKSLAKIRWIFLWDTI